MGWSTPSTTAGCLDILLLSHKSKTFLTMKRFLLRISYRVTLHMLRNNTSETYFSLVVNRVLSFAVLSSFFFVDILLTFALKSNHIFLRRGKFIGWWLLISSIIIIAGCNVTRNFAPNEHLLIKNKFKILYRDEWIF